MDREAVFWHYPHYHQEGGVPYSAVRKGNWKLIEIFETHTFELYNLKEDIGEQHNVLVAHPEKAAELKKDLISWRAEVGAQYATPNENYVPNKQRKKTEITNSFSLNTKLKEKNAL